MHTHTPTRMTCALIITLSLLVVTVQGLLYANSAVLYASAGSQYQLYIWGEFPLVVGKTITVTFGITAVWYVCMCACYFSFLSLPYTHTHTHTHTSLMCAYIRFPSDVSRLYDAQLTLTNGGNYYSNGNPVAGQTTYSFTPQQGKVTVGVTFKEDVSWSSDPTTTNSVVFDLLQGGADAYWKGFTYYPYSPSGGCGGNSIAQGRIWGIGKHVCVHVHMIYVSSLLLL